MKELPPLVQGEAGTLLSTGGAGLSSLRLVCRVQLETNRKRASERGSVEAGAIVGVCHFIWLFSHSAHSPSPLVLHSRLQAANLSCPWWRAAKHPPDGWPGQCRAAGKRDTTTCAKHKANTI